MATVIWLIVCVSSLMVMAAMVIRWYMLRKALLNNPTLLEQRQQVFAVTPYVASVQRHGLGFVPNNRCPVVIHAAASSAVTYNHNGSDGGYVNHTVVQTRTGRISGPPTYEQAVSAATTILPPSPSKGSPNPAYSSPVAPPPMGQSIHLTTNPNPHPPRY